MSLLAEFEARLRESAAMPESRRSWPGHFGIAEAKALVDELDRLRGEASRLERLNTQERFL